MPSVFLEPEQLTAGQLTIAGEQAHHLVRVLRVKVGTALWLLDGRGGRYPATVKEVSRDRILVERGDRETPDVEASLRVRLVQALPKADKMAWIVEKCTELGVATISPVITERSDVKSTRRVERWRRIAESAAAQSGRVRVPHVEAPRPFLDVLNECDPPGFLCWERSTGKLRAFLQGLVRPAGTAVVFIGPEGGFTLSEVAAAKERGHGVVSLGPRTLRTETAALAAVSVLMLEAGELG